MTSNTVQFGAPLTQPVIQTLIPVVEQLNSTAKIHGYLPLASTVFSGTETQVTIDSIVTPIKSVTLPEYISDAHFDRKPKQYMAYVLTEQEAKIQPWRGYSGWMSNQQIGFSSQWCNPMGSADNRFVFGPLIGSLEHGMNRYTTVPVDPSTPPNPDVSDASYSWYAELNASGNPQTFFDFNWMVVLQSHPIPNIHPGQLVSQRLEVISNPESGEFKASVLSSQPTIGSDQQQIFDTVRILQMTETVAPGTYEFEFRVYQTTSVETHTDVTFTLVVK